MRPIEPGDIGQLFELRASTRENPMSREALRKLDITEESTAAALQTTHRGWLCEEKAGIVGFSIGDGKTGEVCVLAVLPEFEGQGIGSRLLSTVESWLFGLGWPELWLWTSPEPNKRAFSFYKRRGWVVSESKLDKVIMRKSLFGK